MPLKGDTREAHAGRFCLCGCGQSRADGSVYASASCKNRVYDQHHTRSMPYQPTFIDRLIWELRHDLDPKF
jgi:hypothetical protein